MRHVLQVSMRCLLATLVVAAVAGCAARPLATPDQAVDGALHPAGSTKPFPACTEGVTQPRPDDFQGITIIPLEGAERDAATAAEIVRAGFLLPVRVLPARPIPLGACRTENQLGLEEVMEAVYGSIEPRRAVLVITAHDLRSDEFGWQFGGWSENHNLGVISTARFGDFRGPERAGSAVRRRLATLVNKYVLVLYFDARTRPDDSSSSLLGPKYSFEQLDVAQADPCEYRDAARTDAQLLRCT